MRIPGHGIRIALVVALAAPLGLVPHAADEGQKDEAVSAAAPDAETAADDERDAPGTRVDRDAEAPARRPGAPPHASDFPPGVTVLAPRAAARIDATMFPQGVTILRRPGADAGSAGSARVTVRVERRRPTADPDERADDAPGGGLAQLLEPQRGTSTAEAKTVGPSLGEQLAVFGAGTRTAGGVARDATIWSPVSAWPEADPRTPYPWNPSRWSEPVFDPVWTPVSAWPERDSGSVYPWQPVRWSAPTIPFSWAPRDAWGRSVGLAEPSDLDAAATRRIAAPPAPPSE
jgi:hypothetical protein